MSCPPLRLPKDTRFCTHCMRLASSFEIDQLVVDIRCPCGWTTMTQYSRNAYDFLTLRKSYMMEGHNRQ